jgi:hypothetical protein
MSVRNYIWFVLSFFTTFFKTISNFNLKALFCDIRV